MNSRTLARRLERLETKINPTAKQGITVIVVRAGEPEAEINPTANPGINVIVEKAGEPKIFPEGNRLDD